MYSFVKNTIKEEIPDDNLDSKECQGKIIDYQFLVKPKQEQCDTKPNLASLELVCEKIETHDTKYEVNDISCETSRSQVTRITDPKKKVHFCKFCDYKTCNKRNLIRHTQAHTISKENRPHGCTLCDYKTLDRHFILKHFKAKHTERERIFTCNICGHGSTTLLNLKKHSVIHREERRHNCDLCSYKSASKSKLNIHKDYVHFKKKRVYTTVVCDMCGEKFTGITNLNIHLLNKHKVDIEIQTFICYTCGKKYFKRHSFIQHVQKHSNHKEKLFCANCDYSTFNKTNLIQHLVKHDKHVKMHKCEMCSFETKRAHTLRHHVKTHFKDLAA